MTDEQVQQICEALEELRTGLDDLDFRVSDLEGECHEITKSLSRIAEIVDEL
jgi:hypothetical protein